MANIPPVVDFPRALKQSLTPLLPQVKSSHLSEAIAFSLGFRTNIALNTAIRGGAVLTLESLQNEQFFARLATLGYPALPRFRLSDVIAAKQLADDRSSTEVQRPPINLFQNGRRDGSRLDAFRDVVPEGWKMFENHDDYRDGFIIGMAETADKIYLNGGIAGATVIGKFTYEYRANGGKLAEMFGLTASLRELAHHAFLEARAEAAKEFGDDEDE